MNQVNLRIILVLLAAVVLGGVYMYVYKPNMDEKETIDSDIESLQTRYDNLKKQEVHRDEYIKLTQEYNEKFDEVVEDFPATLDQEISVMFMKGIEKNQGDLMFDIKTVGLGAPQLFYSLGSGGSSSDDVTTSGASGSYDCYSAAFPISYEGSYEGIKDLINYVLDYKYEMSVESINIAYDSNNDSYTGIVTLDAYCVTGGDRKADTVTTDVSNGVSNIFLGGSGATVPSTGSSVTAATSDVKITLNNANGDSTSGVVVAAGSNSLSYADNDVTTVDVKVEENDGKKTATITLNGKDITVDISDDATSFNILVNSSERVDSDDTNGIKLNVDNGTSISVNVTVNGDDSSSPRFNMGSKSGTVKVN